MKNIFILLMLFSCLCAEAIWTVSFNEKNKKFTLKNGPYSIELEATFTHENPESGPWYFAQSRDAVKDRYCLVDPKGDVQGYLRFAQDSDDVEILFIHRTAQNYGGTLKMSGEISGGERAAILCRARPSDSERVLNLNLGGADCPNQDALFSPERDEILSIDAKNMTLKNLGGGRAELSVCSDVKSAEQSSVSISLKKDWFKKRYAPYFKAAKFDEGKPAPSGWMSWNTYFDKATAEDNLSEARIGKKYLKPFGCEYWSIESWQENSDKLPVSKFHNLNLKPNPSQFPEGMKKLAEDIRSLGFKPGIWIAPFATGNAEFYNAHKDWFLHDADGNPLSCWNGIYTLDPTNDEVTEYMEKLFKTAANEWGYEFFKIDGMSGRNKGYCAHMFERPEVRAAFKNPDCKNPFERCVAAFRRGIGNDSYFLACQGHLTGPDAAYADAARSGADIVSPNKPVMWKNVLNQAVCTANQLFGHNISMVLDPDTLLVKDLDAEQARVSATVIALPGQLTFFGDKLAGLTPDKMKILQQTLPPVRARPSALYPYFRLPEVWALSIKSEVLGSLKTVALFNFSDADADISASAEELGLNKEKSYGAFEFWTQTPIEDIRLPFAWKVPARGVRVFGIFEKSDIPRWIGSDRHISLSGMEIAGLKWNADSLKLTGKILFPGDFPLSEFFSLPQGLKVVSARCNNAQAEIHSLNSAFKISFKPDSKKAQDHSPEDFEISFSR